MPWVHAAYFWKDMQRLGLTKCWNTLPYGDSNEICSKKKPVRPHLQIDFLHVSGMYFLVPDFQIFLSSFPDFLISSFSWFPFSFLIYFHHFPDFHIFPFFISRYFHFIIFLFSWSCHCTRATTACQWRFNAISWMQVCFFRNWVLKSIYNFLPLPWRISGPRNA